MMSAPARSGLKHLIGLAALLIAALAVWQQEGAPDLPRDAVAPDAPDAPEQVAASEQDPEPRPAADRERLEFHWMERALGAEVQGNVPDPAGKIEARLAWRASGLPVEGARVTLTREPLDTLVPQGEIDVDDTPDVMAVTDFRGMFVLDGVPRRESWFLRFEKEGFAEVRPLRTLPDDPWTQTWQGEYRVEEQGSITGRVVGELGEPLADLRVRAIDDPLFGHPELPHDIATSRRRALHHFDPAGNEFGVPLPDAVLRRDGMLPFPETTTDADGRFVLEGVRNGEVELVMHGAGHAGTVPAVVVEPWADTDVGTVAALRALRYEIRIVDTLGRPVSGLAVAVRWAALRFGPPPDLTDGDGRVAFDVVGAESYHAEHPSSRPTLTVTVRRTATAPWEPLGAVSELQSHLVLPPPGTREFRVRTPEGQPVRGVRWWSVPEIPGLTTHERPDGVHEVSGLPLGIDVVLVAAASGRAPAVLADWRTGDEPIDLTLFDAVSARVRVVDEGNRPVAGALVLAHTTADSRYTHERGADWEALGPLPIGRTDADGTLTAPGLVPTRTELLVQHEDFGQSYSQTVYPEEGAEYVIRVDRFAALSGAIAADFTRIDRRLRVEARHRPLTAFEGHREPVTTVSTAEGFFEFPRLVSGTYIVRAIDPAPVLMHVHEVAPEPRVWAEEEVILGPGMDLHHVVLQVEEPPPPPFGGVVRVDGEGRPGLHVRIPPSPWRREALEAETDARGEFRFSHSPARDDSIEVWLENLGLRTRLATFEIPTERRRPVDDVAIDLVLGTIDLDVRDPAGNPLAHRVLRFHENSADLTMLFLTDQDGRVISDTMPPGRWSVKLPESAGDDAMRFPEHFDVAEGETVRLRLQAVQ